MTPYVVTATHEAGFGFAGSRTVARYPESRSAIDGRQLLRVNVPYRAAWFAKGLLDDGWTVQDDTPVLLFPRSARAERWRMTLTLYAPAEVQQLRSWSVETPGARRAGRLGPNRFATTSLSICVEPDPAPTEVHLRVRGKTALPDGRLVGLILNEARAAPTGRPCARPGSR
jgi:hypothetical protein